MKTVVVGMSGGVDSSLAAALLKEQGYRVIGLFMKNWEETNPEGLCESAKDYEDVLKTSECLAIPCYSVNFVKEYQERVFSHFLSELEKGRTPNPDILCNREIKFDALYKKARELGADFLATGHYAQVDKGRLLKGVDPNKDQTYFLHAIKKEILEKVLFPIGHLPKHIVREEALKRELPTARKKDSTGICFIGKRDFKPFILNYLKKNPGDFCTLDGQTVGTHDGAIFYTIGQRRGLGLGGEGDAWYVVDKKIEKNIVFVERGENHPALFKEWLKADTFTWIGEAPKMPLKCGAKIRYRQQETPCTLFENGEVLFEEPQRAITSGQSVVFYLENVCLGGAVIL